MKNKIKQTSIVFVLALLALTSFVSAGVGYTSNQEEIVIDDPIIEDTIDEEKPEFNEKAQYPTLIEVVAKTISEFIRGNSAFSVVFDEEKPEFNEKAQYPTLIEVVAKTISKN